MQWHFKRRTEWLNQTPLEFSFILRSNEKRLDQVETHKNIVSLYLIDIATTIGKYFTNCSVVDEEKSKIERKRKRGESRGSGQKLSHPPSTCWENARPLALRWFFLRFCKIIFWRICWFSLQSLITDYKYLQLYAFNTENLCYASIEPKMEVRQKWTKKWRENIILPQHTNVPKLIVFKV